MSNFRLLRSISFACSLHFIRIGTRTDGTVSKGNKSIIINRIQEYEESRALPFSQPAPAASRNVSSSTTPPQAVSPGIPPASQPTSAPKTPDFFLVRLPDLSQDGPWVPVQAVSIFPLSLIDGAVRFKLRV